MSPQNPDIAIVGGGLVGSLLSMFLARRGQSVVVYERRPDMRSEQVSAGRSINLVATQRGITALERLGLREEILEVAVPVYGRMMHSNSGELTYQPYGKDDSECNYSISRGELNQMLITEAEKRGVRFQFDHRLETADFHAGRLEFEDTANGGTVTVTVPRVFGADGSGSRVRDELEKLPGYTSTYEDLGHGYKELLIPAGENGSFSIEGRALHIWPRGHFMMMALPNRDGSFTVTLYLPQEGAPSFASLDSPDRVGALFTQEFADSVPLLPGLPDEYFENPSGRLGTVRCERWTFEDRVALIGDAAHAIVPFFGQGMNCGFEDCVVLDDLMERHGEDWRATLDAYGTARKPDGDAIADMALENFVEMRDHVGDEAFILRKQVEHRLESSFPSEYRSRYSMVVYSQIPYHLAQEAGVIQTGILRDLCEGLTGVDQIDLERAHELVRERLTPFLSEHALSLDY